MSKYVDQAKVLREDPTRHYSCVQATVLPFLEEKGVDRELVCSLCANLNAGLRQGATCGAVLGGLMTLGLYGADDPQTVGEYYRRVKEKHDGMTDCADLLRVSKEKGEVKKAHCDGMVYECVTLTEDMLRARGLLKE